MNKKIYFGKRFFGIAIAVIVIVFIGYIISLYPIEPDGTISEAHLFEKGKPFYFNKAVYEYNDNRMTCNGDEIEPYEGYMGLDTNFYSYTFCEITGGYRIKIWEVDPYMYYITACDGYIRGGKEATLWLIISWHNQDNCPMWVYPIKMRETSYSDEFLRKFYNFLLLEN